MHDVFHTFNSLTRIYPFTEEGHEYVYSNISRLRNLFYHLTGPKDRQLLTSSKFEALYKSRFIKSCEMQRIDLTILF